MMQIFMTMEGGISSILCGNGRVCGVAYAWPAGNVLDSYFMDKPIPAHENGVRECKITLAHRESPVQYKGS